MKKNMVWIGLIVVGVLVLFVVWVLVPYPSAYAQRLLRWRDADVYDYQKFPARTIAASDTPFVFEEDLQETAVANLFATSDLIESDLETFLTETNTQAFIVIQDDKILYEEYFNGAERDTIVTSFSVAKSFASTLIGLAIAEGFINSVDDPITDYLPELLEQDPTFAQITIHDLLMMSSGIQYEEIPSPRMDDARTYYYPDLRSIALNDTNIVGTPGETFLYNNYHPCCWG